MKTMWVAALVLVLGLTAIWTTMAGTDWTWSFGTESGTFRASGSYVGGTVPPGRYTTDVSSFTVLSSALPGNAGASYTENQPAQGFDWDGTNATVFWRASGIFVNGLNFFRADGVYIYCFQPVLSDSEVRGDGGDSTLVAAPVTLTPVAPAPDNSNPAPANTQPAQNLTALPDSSSSDDKPYAVDLENRIRKFLESI